MNINILTTGAVADGVTLNTESIQKAIDLCAENGGGRVEVPAGTFITGTIWLKSHVELYLEQGAVLKASTNMDDYNELDAYPQNYSWLPEEWVGKHLIITVGQTDVAISGHGTIDGSGNDFFEPWQACTWANYTWSYGCSVAANKETWRPGQMVVFVECDHVRVTDVTLQNTPCWACFFHGCEYVWARGIRVQNEKHFCNSDGLDIDTCRFVTVSDCIIDTGDDAIAIRCAAKRLQKKTECCEYVTITNCVLGSCSSVFRLGVGHGQIRHITISNINIFRGATGFNLMSAYLKNGCARMENILISNVVADQVSFPFSLTEYNNAYLRNITIDGYRAKGMCASRIYADDPGTISNITFRNVEIELMDPPFPVRENEQEERGDVALSVQGARDVHFENVKFTIPENISHKWRTIAEITDSENITTTNCNFG